MLAFKTKPSHLLIAVMLASIVTVLSVGVVLAHETRAVGKYQFVVGFATEPAFVNIPNSIDLRVTNTETKAPVEGAEKTLKAEVTFGGKSRPVTLRARFGQPGAYLGDFIPTRAGTYIFHFVGQIENTPVDEKFESGPGRFNDVADPGELQFPEQIPAPLDEARQVKAAQDAASSAQTLAYAGIALGALGVILGGLSLARHR